jgi:hypothetical protein
MNILCYSSCYGSYFKDKIISTTINIFTVILWYLNKKKDININEYSNYDILICEYVRKRDEYYSSDEFIEKIKSINPNIKIVIYPLMVLNIFPFYKHDFGFLTNRAINRLIDNGLSDKEILDLYNNNKIEFNPKEELQLSLERLIQIEKKCNIKISNIIEKYYNEPICYDSLFPTDRIINSMLEQILRITNLKADIHIESIDNSIKNYHISTSVFTEEMIRELNIQNRTSSPNYKEYYYTKLQEYLECKRQKRETDNL